MLPRTFSTKIYTSDEICHSYDARQQALTSPDGSLSPSGRLWDEVLEVAGDEATLIHYLAMHGAHLITVESCAADNGIPWLSPGQATPAPPLRARGMVGPLPRQNSSESPESQGWYLGALHVSCGSGHGNQAESSAKTSHEGPRSDDGGTLALWQTLLEQAKHLAQAAGGTQLVSPLSLSSWFPYRLRLDDEPLAYPWEPQRLEGLDKAYEAAGFLSLECYRSVGSSGLQAFAQRIRKPYEEARGKGFTFSSLAAMPDQAKALRRLWEICQDAFRKSPYFAPISFEDFVAFYLAKIPSKDSSSAPWGRRETLCISPSGEIAGFILGYCVEKELVFKSMAIDRPFQGHRLGDAVLYPMAAEAVGLGIDNYVSALVLSGNKSEFVFRNSTTRWEHRYGMFGCELNQRV